MKDFTIIVNNEDELEVLDLPQVPAEDGKYYVIDLHPRMYKGNNYILNKYFRFKNHDLDRFHIPELSKEEYEECIKTFKNVKEHNLKFETATDYYKKKVMLRLISNDLGISEYDLDLTDYKWDESWYEFKDFDDNVEYMEDKFKEESKDRNEITMHELYIGSECPRKCNIDEEIWNELYNFSLNCIKTRIAMIFEIPSVISMLHNILEYTDGFSTFATQNQVDSMQSIYKKLINLTKNKELVDYLKAGNNDYTLYAEGITKSDYIRTYRNMLKILEGMSPSDNSNIEFYKDIIHNAKDTLENEIICSSDDIEYQVLGYLDKKLYEGGEDEEEAEDDSEEDSEKVIAY